MHQPPNQPQPHTDGPPWQDQPSMQDPPYPQPGPFYPPQVQQPYSQPAPYGYPPPYPQPHPPQQQYYQPPPQYYPPPVMQPPMMVVQQPPQRHNGCLVAALVLGLILVIGAIGAAIEPKSSTAPDTPQATDTPVPTPNLSKPSGIRQYALQLAQDSATTANSDTITSAYEPTTKTITITETLDEQLDDNAYRNSIQGDCYNIQKAIWQGGIPHLSLVEVDISGPLIDKYGKTSTGLMGYCILKHSTEKLFQWDNLTWEQAWTDYNTAWMLP